MTYDELKERVLAGDAFNDLNGCTEVEVTDATRRDGQPIPQTYRVLHTTEEANAAVLDPTQDEPALVLADVNVMCSCISHKKNDYSLWFFANNVNMSSVEGLKNANFAGATFGGKANFKGAKFEGKANFSGAQFKGKVIFSRANFRNGISFMKSKFRESCYFDGIKIEGTFSIEKCTFCDRVSIEEYRYENNEEIIPNVDNGKVRLYEVVFRAEFFLGKLYEELKSSKFTPFILDDDPAATMKTFRILEKVYRNDNRLDRELEMHYYFKKYERMAARKEKTRNPLSIFCSWFFLDVCTKYLTSWVRVLVVSFFVWLAFAGIYMRCADSIVVNKLVPDLPDVCATTEARTYVFPSNTNAQVTVSMPLVCATRPDAKYRSKEYYLGDDPNLCTRIASAAYFSLITFTTIGYANIQPSGTLQLLTGLESFLGVLLVAAFMVTLAKRVLG